MESDKPDPERQAFEILELIEALRDATWCQSSACRDHNIEQFLDDIEDSYRSAMEPWVVHRTTPDELAHEDFYRWHEYMFPPDVFQEARWRFNELVTTSRFSVEETPCLHDLEQVNSANDKINQQHIVSLAAIACIRFTLEDLESIEFLDAQKDIDRISDQIEKARSLKMNADLWLSHMATLCAAQRQTVFERKEQPRAASKKPRKPTTAAVTPELVAIRFNIRTIGKKWETILTELAEEFNVSESTIARHYRKAKKKNLLSQRRSDSDS